MRRVAVIGVGVTQFGRHERTSAELFAEAAADALADAGLPASAVQALYYGNVVGGETEKQLHTGPQAASVLGIPTVPTTRFETACASSHAAFRHAVMEVGAGVSDVVLVGGAERVLNVTTEESTEYFAYASDARWEQTLGLTFPGVFALVARAHMSRYGTTEEQMAAVAVKNHKHGTLNPKAQFQKEITLEQVLGSARVADPLKLYDCCPFTDGGAAVVLASEEVARKARISGIVIVECIIDKTGNVTNVQVLKPLPFGLDQAAVEAVKRWKFKPGTLNGQPVDVIFNLTVNFKLN